MATAASGSSHLGVTENQKRWLVAGIALNKILIPQIRPFVEQGINTEYSRLKTSHNIHIQSTSGRLQRWPARKVLKYENINGNDVHPKLPDGKFNYSLFDCQVTSHADFARLYVQNFMAHFTVFDDHCDASAVLTLLGGVPVFSAAVQTAAGNVRMGRNDWAHCNFSNWDQAKFQQTFCEMQHLVSVMALPSADEGKLLGELKDWENKGTHLCMNSPVEPALLQLVQQELKSLQDSVNNMSVEGGEEKRKVQHELQNVATTLEEMERRMQRVEDGQQSLEHRTEILEGRIDDFEGDVNQKMERLESNQQSTGSRTILVEDRVRHLQGDVQQRMKRLESSQQSTESRTMLVEHKVHHLQEQVEDLTISKESSASTCRDSPTQPAFPDKLVELIRRDYKGAALCPFPWCEDELQLELSNIFTRLKIVSKEKERARPTDDIVNMTDVFKPRKECDKPRVVLIEGQPGMGKTTYCQKLAYDWSVENISPEASFPKVEMLLLLKCRDMKTANIEEAIDDQLLPQDANKREKENFCQFIRCNQSRILLILDGLDELRRDLFQTFLPLIKGKVFSNTYLMLTARHEAGMKVRRHCDILLEIVGYTDEDADSYITKYFSNHEDPRLATTMIEKLKNDSQLRELTVNPLNTTLLCLLYEDAKGVLPANRTKLYNELVSCALRRNCAKKGVPLDTRDPVERFSDQLNQLGKVALQALIEDRMYFSEDEMKCHSTDFLLLCFLSREASVSKIRPTPCYAFTHKTFQEYFAALYMAQELLTGDKAERDTLLAKFSPVDKYWFDKYWQVWEFLFTMVVSKNHDDAMYLLSRLCACFYHEKPEKLIETKEDADINARICEDASYDWVMQDIKEYSMKEKVVQHFLVKTFQLIAECESDENELKDYQKKMVHTLAHCLPVHKFEVGRDQSRGFLVLSEYLKANCSLLNLNLSGQLDESALPIIKVVLQSDHKLVHLCSSGTPVFATGVDPDLFYRFHVPNMSFDRYLEAKVLAELHSNRTLTHLSVRNGLVFDPGAEAVAHVIQFNRSLTHLNLHCSWIQDKGATALAQALLSNCTLTHLSLPKNWITDLGAEEFATALQFNYRLKFLDLSGNQIGNRGVMALAKGLESNITLTCLNLHGQYERRKAFDVPRKLISESGASALAKVLQTNCTLTYLDLQENAIGDSGAAALGKALQSNHWLTHLYLKGNEIDDRGAKALVKALQPGGTFTQLNPDQQTYVDDSGVAEVHFSRVKVIQSDGTCGTQLTHLDLSGNKISSTGATALADALQSNRVLERLDLSSNKIDCSGAAALAKALRFNRSLTHLDLKSNDIGDSGALEFAETLEYNFTLTVLDLTSNPIGELGVENLRLVDQSICTVKNSDPANHL
ncbi:uncharacterized protein LOC144664463 isoform X6 [Oculina patagonica]